MTQVEVTDGRFTVDATVLAEALEIPARDVLRHMRDGRLTSICETGIGEDEGKWRLTFRYGGRALRLTVDAQGNILKRARFAAPQPRRGASQPR